MQKPKKILLVEDNYADAELTRIAFRNQAITNEIIHCKDGKEALSYMRDNAIDNIKYALFDLNMPKLNGLELLKICKRDPLFQRLPIIVFTTSANHTDVEECYQNGANAYVLKPVDLEDFDQAILAIHNFWGEVNIPGNA